MSTIEPNTRGHRHGLTLHFSDRDNPFLSRSTLSASGLTDEKGQPINSLTARSGRHYKWSWGVRAFSVLVLEQRLWHLSPQTDHQATQEWRKALYNVLNKQSAMVSTEWVKEICGYQGNGRSYLYRLFTNRGSSQNPSPVWNNRTLSQASIIIFWEQIDISSNEDEMASLFGNLNQVPQGRRISSPPNLLGMTEQIAGRMTGITAEYPFDDSGFDDCVAWF